MCAQSKWQAAKNVTSLLEVPIVLVGQKEDLFDKRKVTAGEAIAFAKVRPALR